MSNKQHDSSQDALQDDRDALAMQIHSELDDFPLNAEAFRVYAHLVRRAGKNRKAWPSYQNIGERCFRASYPKAAKSTLKIKAIDAVRELVAYRLIAIEHKTAAAGDATSNVYHIMSRSQWTKKRDANFESANIRKGGSGCLGPMKPGGGWKEWASEATLCRLMSYSQSWNGDIMVPKREWGSKAVE